MTSNLCGHLPFRPELELIGAVCKADLKAVRCPVRVFKVRAGPEWMCSPVTLRKATLIPSGSLQGKLPLSSEGGWRPIPRGTPGPRPCPWSEAQAGAEPSLSTETPGLFLADPH